MPIDPWEFQGLKKADQQTILDDFNKHGTGIKQPSTVPPVVLPAAPAAPTASTHTPTNSMVSREDVLTRAAALGRGAATTGFKRFLALTEAAKDRKDGPFRKLFNPWFIDNDAYITGKCFFVFLCSFLQVKKKKKKNNGSLVADCNFKLKIFMIWAFNYFVVKMLFELEGCKCLPSSLVRHFVFLFSHFERRLGASDSFYASIGRVVMSQKSNNRGAKCQLPRLVSMRCVQLGLCT